ncbi:endonuclease YncB(thermonuclease family) [Mycoplana sp. BE70]|uniref:thermonuclease family protein n=1 Tax=Mycoplana sp. BE70 TaxID=2817775 RepID=UPI00285A286E|nr:thermonuclease family protein [Mycoplana sp. BE70]MDR6755873.1 endonuclease YncB(thermonuclease family) [Mycoplana sp. BE70]
MSIHRRLSALFLTLTSLFLANATAHGADGITTNVIAGPVAAQVIRVVDGDTILVSARPWPQQHVDVFVRLRGIDTPEMKSRCAGDRAAAKTARDLLSSLVLGGDSLFLTDVSADKYFGRVVADVHLVDGRNPAHDLVAAGLATPYDGRTKRPCADSE